MCARASNRRVIGILGLRLATLWKNATMTEPGTSPVELLIAMVSRDVIVLAKLVRTLRPQRVLLFSTHHARAVGWVDNARRALEGIRGRLIGAFEIEQLPDADVSDQLAAIRSKVETCLDAGEVPGGTVAFDCTTGRGILRLLGYEVCRQAAAVRGRPMRIVFCDGDAQRILSALVRDGRVTSYADPIRFRFAEGDEPVAERFSMYGVRVREYRRLWPPAAPGPSGYPVPAGSLKELHRELCSNVELRAFFHSYRNQLNRWKTRQAVRETLEPGHVERFIRQKINEAADRLAQYACCNRSALKEKRDTIINELVNAFTDYAPLNAGNDFWIHRYLDDRQLSGLNRILQNVTSREIKRVLRRRSSLVNRGVAQQLRELLGSLRNELRRIAITRGEAAAAHPASAKDHAAFQEESLDAGLPSGLRNMLLRRGSRVPDLFEACVACAVTDAVAGQSLLNQAVAAVYRNVVVQREQQVLSELDTVVLLQTGDVLAFEAKTHYTSADHKKIEANIKALRDFGGAYSTYALVFPLTRGEIKELGQGNATLQGKLESLGMADAASWAAFIRRVADARDQRIVGIDELRAAVCRAVAPGTAGQELARRAQEPSERHPD